ncbi:MAG: B12-binding domain-containing radical SAM protein [Eubacteriaceae bacterium]|nr:B12-binding domain-containing radical SAM protein [Eubacteriaceae bacterium]
MLAEQVPKELKATISVFDEFTDKKPPQGHFDIVGITVIASESVRAYELANMYRNAGSFIVLGGYHATFMQSEALLHADAIVTGSGNTAWPELLRDIEAGNPLRQVYEDAFDLSAGFAADRSVTDSKHYCPIGTIIASNGCPNRCKFCAISRMSAYIKREPSEVVNELKSMKHKSVVFFDPNFFADRKYAIDLMKAIKPLGIKWGATATVDIGNDDELLRLAHEAGCIGLLIGFESLSQDSLKGVGKATNIPGKYKEAIDNIHKHKITINGTFVLGFDSDTEQSIADLPLIVRDLGIDLPLYYLLTPTPGSPLYHEMQSQDRLLTSDWSQYNHARVVFQPKNMHPQRLQELHDIAWKKSYSIGSVLRRAFNAKGLSVLQKLVVACMNIGFKYLGSDMPHT